MATVAFQAPRQTSRTRRMAGGSLRHSSTTSSTKSATRKGPGLHLAQSPPSPPVRKRMPQFPHARSRHTMHSSVSRVSRHAAVQASWYAKWQAQKLFK